MPKTGPTCSTVALETIAMSGGDGDDTYVVDTGLDAVERVGSCGFDQFGARQATGWERTSSGWNSDRSARINATGNELDNTLIGNAANNILSGLAGDDSSVGGRGNDVLLGGVGSDRLNGGAGIDRAQYSQANHGLRADLQVPGTNTREAAATPTS